MDFKSGFVNIIGKPNAGKSTLMNLLIGEKLSIITHKAQTTRKRILGIVNDSVSQIIFSDNPGIIINPEYKLQEWMNSQIKIALQDADIILYITTPDEKISEENFVIEKLKHITTPVIILVNKIDLIPEAELHLILNTWREILPGKDIVAISALNKLNTGHLMETVLGLLPANPPYYATDDLTDRNERFFVSEIIREKILKNYEQEIPYSVEVYIEDYKEKPDITVIRAVIYVMKESHKNIIIGKNGAAIKKVGVAARKDIEELIDKKAFLELFVKVKDNWKDNNALLKQFGYD